MTIENHLERIVYILCRIQDPEGKMTNEIHRADVYDPMRVTLPSGTLWFSFYERIEGYVVVDGVKIPIQSKNFHISEGSYYVNATCVTIEEYVKLFPDIGDLVDLKKHGHDLKIVCVAKKNWYVMDAHDTIVNRPV